MPLDNQFNRTTYVKLDHNQLHILSGLTTSLIQGSIDVDTNLDVYDLEKLLNELQIAHNRVKDI